MLSNQGFTFLSQPVHILSPNGQASTRGSGLVSHTSKFKLPQGSVIYASENVAVASPELCFTQMATLLPFPKLLELGFELCGSYGLKSTREENMTQRFPLSSVEKLRSYIENAPGMNGTLVAKKALPHLVDGSASPMETIVVLLLCLPKKMGGYGFPLPILNPQRSMGELSRLTTVKDFYRCDMLWPDAGVSIEYDSKRHHTGERKHAHDKQRANALGVKGIKTMVVTPYQVFHYDLFNDTAAMLAQNLGHRANRNRIDWTPQRMELRRMLLDPLREHNNPS